MKILVVSNLYPPHYLGGYELGARDVVNGLRARGHDVSVLTSTFHLDTRQEEEPGVTRALQFIGGHGRHSKWRECLILYRALQRYRPDVVYFWNQSGLSYWLPAAARRLGYRTAFFLSDTDFVSWRVGAWLAGPAAANSLISRVLGDTFLVRGRPIMQNQPCHFASRFLSERAVAAGIAVAPAERLVAHWGIDYKLFAGENRPPRPLRRLLYVGQIIPQKGVHTAIAAFGLLAKGEPFSECTLTVAGGGQNPAYETQLREMPAQLGIPNRVQFLGKVPRAELPAIYAAHDMLIFPSEWEEPFAITPLEAMASGLIVVGTTTGGSGELFRNRETAMTFASGDAIDCARAIRELCADQKLAEAIRERGNNLVTAQYSLASMVDRIEGGLQKLI